MPYSPHAIRWDTASEKLIDYPEDRALTHAALSCFLQPGPESLAVLESLLDPDPQRFMRQCALVVQAANAVLDEENTAIAELFAQNGTPVVCASGCAGCCHQLVLCRSFEAETIAAFLRANPLALQGFLDTFPKWDTATVDFRDAYLRWAENLYCNGHDDGSHTQGDYHVPCPFLDEALRCRIYAVRPYGCRTSMAVDPTCPAPDNALPGSMNIHSSSLTTHHVAREAVLSLLGRLLPKTLREPMPLTLFRMVAKA